MIRVCMAADGPEVFVIGLLHDRQMPTRHEDGSVTVHDDTLVHVGGADYTEVLDHRTGGVLSSGSSFQCFAPAGSRLLFRRIAASKTFTQKQIDESRSQHEVIVCQDERHSATVFDFGASYEDGSLDRVIGSLIAIRESIPDEYRATARCEIDSEGGYEGSHYASITVSYWRPETDEEVRHRLEQQAIAADIAERAERAKYDELKSKFG